MSPTIVYGPDGHVLLAVGAAGGSTIPAQVAKAIIGVHRLPPAGAGGDRAADDLRAGGDTVYLESGTFLASDGAAARRRSGTQVDHRPPGTFKANAIEWVDGRWVGGADPRSEGAALSE